MLNDYKRINNITITNETEKALLVEGPLLTEEIGRSWVAKSNCQYHEGDDFIRIKTWLFDKPGSFRVDYSYKTVVHEEWSGSGYKVAKVAYGLDLHALILLTPEERVAALPPNTRAYNFRYTLDTLVSPGDIVACLSVNDLKNALVTELIDPTETNREEYNVATAWIIDVINTAKYIETKESENLVNQVNDRINEIVGD